MSIEPVILEQYLEARFLEYFPGATLSIIEADEDDETTTVRVIGPADPDADNMPTYLMTYVCEPGSDDDYFVFEMAESNKCPCCNEGSMITIPFPLGGFC